MHHSTTFGCHRCTDAWNLPSMCCSTVNEASEAAFPMKPLLPSDTCISPGRECHRMSGGLLHMWPAFPLVLCLPQLPPPAPLWKPPLTEPSSAQSTLSDTKSISLAPRATLWPALPHVFAGITVPGPAPVLSVKVRQAYLTSVCVWESCYICLQCVFITGLRAFRSHESIHLQTLCRTCWNVFWARTAMSARLFAAEQKIPTPIWGDLGWTESECQAERGCSPRGQTELLAHTQIAGEEKSHSSQRLELLGTVNEALVKTALNVSEHRKTPVLHSMVGSLPLQVSPPCERRWLSYCKINPPLPTSCSCFPASLTAVPLDGG